jgi:hypothetical protein
MNSEKAGEFTPVLLNFQPACCMGWRDDHTPRALTPQGGTEVLRGARGWCFLRVLATAIIAVALVEGACTCKTHQTKLPAGRR